jgi:hypothetical protein
MKDEQDLRFQASNPFHPPRAKRRGTRLRVGPNSSFILHPSSLLFVESLLKANAQRIIDILTITIDALIS